MNRRYLIFSVVGLVILAIIIALIYFSNRSDEAQNEAVEEPAELTGARPFQTSFARIAPSNIEVYARLRNRELGDAFTATLTGPGLPVAGEEITAGVDENGNVTFTWRVSIPGTYQVDVGDEGGALIHSATVNVI